MVNAGPSRTADPRRLERFSLSALIQLMIVAAVLFAVMATRGGSVQVGAASFEAGAAGGAMGLVIGVIVGILQARGATGVAISTLAGLAVGAVSGVVMFGRANLWAAAIGSLLLLGLSAANVALRRRHEG